MAKKSFSRIGSFVGEKPPAKVTALAKPRSEDVINLDRINLEDRGNWLRAIEACQPRRLESLGELLQEIEAYQGQIDHAVQVAQAQSTIYAYAIGTRLDFIEEKELFRELGYRNLTEFIKAGEVRRPGGSSITTRQVWAYRRVTRGLNDFLELVESLRAGNNLPKDVQEQTALLGQQIHRDVVKTFLESYVDGIAGVLELGVSKLEQVYRLPKAVALSGLLAGQLPLEESLVPMHDVSFSTLRKAISHHGQLSKNGTKHSPIDRTLGQLEQLVDKLVEENPKLNKSQREKLKLLYEKLQHLQDGAE